MAKGSLGVPRGVSNKSVMLLGMGSHFEIWDAAKLAESEAAAIADGMPDVLNNFSF
jgi:MraZ protein